MASLIEEFIEKFDGNKEKKNIEDNISKSNSG